MTIIKKENNNLLDIFDTNTLDGTNDFSANFVNDIIKKVEDNLSNVFDIDTLEILGGMEYLKEEFSKYSFLIFSIKEKKKLFGTEHEYLLFIAKDNDNGFYIDQKIDINGKNLADIGIFFINIANVEIDIVDEINKKLSVLYYLYHYNVNGDIQKIEDKFNIKIELNNDKISIFEFSNKLEIRGININIFYKENGQNENIELERFLNNYLLG